MKKNTTFTAWIAFTVLYGYCLATFPQYILDPKLTTHVAWGARTYAHFNYVYAIALALLIATVLIMTFVRRHRYAWVALPMAVALVVSVPIFTPEKPHMNLVLVMTVWMIITTATVWIYDEDIPRQGKLDKSAYTDYLKAQLQFWGAALLGLLAAILTLAVTATTEAHKSNTTTVTAPGELFMLNILTTVVFSSMLFYCFVGPIYQAAAKTRMTLARFLDIK